MRYQFCAAFLRNAALCLVFLTLSACGALGTDAQLKHAGSPGEGAARGVPAAETLREVLFSELARLGIDPLRHPAEAPSGAENAVFDLKADRSGAAPVQVTLSWTERAVGDYDQNGEVNVADLTPLGLRFGGSVEYVTPPPGGIAHWPLGDPLDDGGAGAENPPEPGSGAENWRLARIDGDGNGELNIADITPIASHWRQCLGGYRVYRRGPGDDGFVLLENPGDPSSAYSVARETELDANRPVRYGFALTEAGTGEVTYYVAPYDAAAEHEGEPSPTVTVNLSGPAAVLTATPDPPEGWPPLTVDFSAADSTDPDGTIVRYEWDLDGDDTFEQDTGAAPTAQHVYTEEGSYTASVRVTDDEGYDDTASLTVTVFSANEEPVASIVPDITDGFIPLLVNFDASASADPDGEIVSYEWDYDGDGTYESGPDEEPEGLYVYTAAGAYEAAVRVTDDVGQTATASAAIEARAMPQAVLVADPPAGTVPFDVDFDASGSNVAYGSIEQYDWDWEGDGTYDVLDGGATASHQYTVTGDYAATVRVTDDYGASATDTVLIAANLAPVAALTAFPTAGAYPLTVDFDASGSIDLDGTIAQYDWDWEGDAAFDLLDGGATPQHVYDSLGDFNATVRVVDDDGATDEASVQIQTVPDWVHTWGGAGVDMLGGLAVDGAGNVYALGGTSSFGVNGADVLLLKYSLSGTLLWERTWGGTGNEEGRGVVVSDDGGVLIAGIADSFSTLNDDDVLLAKFSAAGALEWAKTWGGSAEDVGVAACAYGSGEWWIAGSTESFGAGGDALLLRCAGDGQVLSAKHWGGGGTDNAYDLAMDGSANVYVAGQTASYGTGQRDAFLLKYTAAEALVWEKVWGASDDERAAGIALDADGNVYLSGYSESFGDGSDPNYILLGYTAAGTLSFAQGWGGDNDDYCRRLACAGDRLYVSGGSRSWGVLGTELVLLEYDLSGTLLDQHLWGAPDIAEYPEDAVWAGGMLHIAGAGITAGGYWRDVSGTAGSVTGTALDVDGSAAYCTGTLTDVTALGTLGQDHAGTEDTGGGGGSDTLLMKLDPADI